MPPPPKAHRRNQTRRLPMAVRRIIHQPLTLQGPSLHTRHVAHDPAFIEENKPFRINRCALVVERFAFLDHIRAMLFLCFQSFF